MSKNNKCEELLYLCKDKFGKLITNNNSLEKYKKKPGVWVMWGKTEESDYACLEVGQSQDICKELGINLKYLEKDYSNVKITTETYSAQGLFGFSKRFEVYKKVEDRRRAKYRDIANNYAEIRVCLIPRSNEIKEKRECIEYKYAVDHQALYWNAWGKQRRAARLYYETQLDK